MHMKKNEMQPMSNDARIAVLETTIVNINTTLLDLKRSFEKMDNKFDSKFDAMDKKFEAKFEKFEAKFEAMDKKFDSKFDALQNRIWSNFLWMMGMMIGLASLIAHTQHWI